MKLLNIIVAAAGGILIFPLGIFGHSPTTTVIGGNLEVKDDPDTPLGEGVLIVNKNLIVGTLSLNHYYEYAGEVFGECGTGNLILGMSSNSYSYSYRSILMGYGTFQNAQNSIMMGGGYIRESKNSISMGNGDMSSSESSILMGNAYSNDNKYSIVSSNSTNYISNLQNSFFLGKGAASSANTSIILGDTATYVDSLTRSIAIGAVNSSYSIDSILIGKVKGYSWNQSILIGTIQPSGYNNGGMHMYLHGENIEVGSDLYPKRIFMFGSNLKLQTVQYMGSSEITDVFSVGTGNSSKSSYSYQFGIGLRSESLDSFVVGRYNEFIPYEIDPSTSYPNFGRSESDSIFTVANGTSDTARSNALVVKRNGDTKIEGNLDVKSVKLSKAAGGIPMGFFGRN